MVRKNTALTYYITWYQCIYEHVHCILGTESLLGYACSMRELDLRGFNSPDYNTSEGWA